MSIWKDCDIRGIYGEEFGVEDAYKIGRAIGTMIQGRDIIVAGDVRVSTPELKSELIRGLMETGAAVCDAGMLPTPVFYFAKKYLGKFAGVMVTASHNPAEYNGFKVMIGDSAVEKSQLDTIQRIFETCKFADGTGTVTAAGDMETAYIRSIKKKLGCSGGLKVVVDAGNGAMSELAPKLFREMGYDTVPLYCDFDGSFPNRNPNPAAKDALGGLMEAVKKNGADLGAAFDGDGDRVVFVDDKGRKVESEQSLVVFIRHYLRGKAGSVVYDLKSSSIVEHEVKRLGGIPLMERSGHAFIKKRYLDNGSVIAGEISGHFFFKELGQDDGLYAALKMAEIIEESGEKLSYMVDGMEKTCITPDLRVKVPYSEQERVLHQVEKLDGDKSYIDGVRVETADGWMLVRKSVTEQAVTIRAEAKDEAAMRRMEKKLRDNVDAFKDLKLM